MKALAVHQSMLQSIHSFGFQRASTELLLLDLHLLAIVIRAPSCEHDTIVEAQHDSLDSDAIAYCLQFSLLHLQRPIVQMRVPA